MRYKKSYKQMWAYAKASRSVKKQTYWLKRIYTKKIREAEKSQDYTRAEYLKTLKSGARKRVLKARRFGGVGRIQNWNIATEKDIRDLVIGGKKTNNNLLILDDGNRKIIAYEGTQLYDEIVEQKQVLAEAVGIDTDELEGALAKV